MITCGCGCRTTGVGGFVFLPLVLLLFFGNLRRMQENNCETFSPKMFFVQCTPRTYGVDLYCTNTCTLVRIARRFDRTPPRGTQT